MRLEILTDNVEKERNIMKEKVMNSYYDGHYIDSGRSLEEIERLIKEETRKSEQLTEWPNDTQKVVVKKSKILKAID